MVVPPGCLLWEEVSQWYGGGVDELDRRLPLRVPSAWLDRMIQGGFVNGGLSPRRPRIDGPASAVRVGGLR